MVIGTDCTYSCKSNYHRITARKAPYKRDTTEPATTVNKFFVEFYRNQVFENLTRSLRGVLDTILCHKVWQWLAAGSWFSTGTTVSAKGHGLTIYQARFQISNGWYGPGLSISALTFWYKWPTVCFLWLI
jgi:hypothetical protein